MTDNAPPPRSVSGQRGRRLGRRVWQSRVVWVAVAGLLLLTTLLAWVLLTDYRGKRTVLQMKQALSDRGIAISPPDEPSKFENGARWYLAAAAALAFDEKHRPVTPLIGNAEWPLFGEAISDEQRDVLRRVMEPNAAALALVHRADEHSGFSYGWHAARPLDVVSDEVGGLRRLMRWLTLNSDLSWAEGDEAGAVRWALATLRLGDRVGPADGMLHHAAVKNAGLSIGRGQLEMLLSRGEIGASDLLAAETALAASHAGIGFIPMLERVAADVVAISTDADRMSLRSVAAAYAGLAIADEIAVGFGADPDDLEPSKFETIQTRTSYAWSLLNPGSLQLQIHRELTAYLDVLARIKARETTETIESVVEANVDAGLEMMAGLATQERVNRMLRTELQTAVWGLRAERFRLRHGRWPIGISELVDFVSSHSVEAESERPPPVDAWSQPLRTTQTEEGFRVYSVGIDGIDHGGYDSWEEFPDATERPDDWNFRLLDPRLRGRTTSVTELAGEPPPSLQEVMEELGELVEEFEGSLPKE